MHKKCIFKCSVSHTSHIKRSNLLVNMLKNDAGNSCNTFGLCRLLFSCCTCSLSYENHAQITVGCIRYTMRGQSCFSRQGHKHSQSLDQSGKRRGDKREWEERKISIAPLEPQRQMERWTLAAHGIRQKSQQAARRKDWKNEGRAFVKGGEERSG